MHLVEQWLGLLTDLGRADATIKAYRGALTHYLRYCEANSIIHLLPVLKIFPHIYAPAPWNGTAGRQCRSVAHFGHSGSGTSIFITRISVKPARYPGQCCPAGVQRTWTGTTYHPPSLDS
jgi:hypothetical protein